MWNKPVGPIVIRDNTTAESIARVKICRHEYTCRVTWAISHHFYRSEYTFAASNKSNTTNFPSRLCRSAGQILFFHRHALISSGPAKHRREEFNLHPAKFLHPGTYTYGAFPLQKQYEAIFYGVSLHSSAYSSIVPLQILFHRIPPTVPHAQKNRSSIAPAASSATQTFLQRWLSDSFPRSSSLGKSGWLTNFNSDLNLYDCRK